MGYYGGWNKACDLRLPSFVFVFLCTLVWRRFIPASSRLSPAEKRVKWREWAVSVASFREKLISLSTSFLPPFPPSLLSPVTPIPSSFSSSPSVFTTHNVEVYIFKWISSQYIHIKLIHSTVNTCDIRRNTDNVICIWFVNHVNLPPDTHE